MPIGSKDVQYGAAIGFVIIVGVVAIQFGFSAKLVLGLLAGVGALLCASVFDGLPRAAMIGASAVLLLLVAYDLATTCEGACKQSKVEAARQRAAQEQVQLAAGQGRLSVSQPFAPECNINRQDYHYGAEKPPKPFNPGGRCAAALFFAGHCIYLTQAGHNDVRGPYCKSEGATVRDKSGNTVDLPVDIEYAWSADKPFDGSIGLWQPRYTRWFQ